MVRADISVQALLERTAFQVLARALALRADLARALCVLGFRAPNRRRIDEADKCNDTDTQIEHEGSFAAALIARSPYYTAEALTRREGLGIPFIQRRRLLPARSGLSRPAGCGR